MAKAIPLNSISQRRWLVILTTIGLPLSLYFGNPAVALMIGAAISLVLDGQTWQQTRTVSKFTLQGAIVLLGLTMNLASVVEVTGQYTIPIALYVVLTLLVGLVLARGLGVESNTGRLLTAGTAICGGTAIATLSPVIGAKAQQTAVALATVFILNALALFAFPAIGHYLDLSQTQFGVWCALAIHDTSSVVATAAIYGEQSAELATTIKLGRTLWLIPLAFGLSIMMRADQAKVRIPLFIILFLVAVGLGSLLNLPVELTSVVKSVSKSMLVLALFFTGLELTRATVAQIRGTALVFALVLWVGVASATLGWVISLE